MTIRRTGRAAPALTLALTLAVAGCATTTGQVSDDPPRGSNADTGTGSGAVRESGRDVPAEEPVEDDPQAEPDDGIAAFGETYEWADGIAVTISRPQTFRRDRWAAGGEKFKHFVRFTVTVVNGTQERYEPMAASDTLQSGDREADAVFQDDLDGNPSTVLLPGRQATWDIGYGVQNPRDLVLEFAPDWDHESVIYTNTQGAR